MDLTQPGPNGGQPVAIEWQLTVPGTLLEHNAGDVNGQTLVWAVAPGQRANLHAESSVGLSLETLGATGAILLAGACGLLLAVAGLFALRRRRSHVSPAPAA